MTDTEKNKKEEMDRKTARETVTSPSDRRPLWLLVSLIFNIGMMFLLFRLFDPVFEGNDDITVVQFANGSCGSFDPHLVYQNYLMGLALSGLYRLFPAFPWYSWFQFWALCLSFTAVTYVLCCRLRKGAGFGAALLVQSFAAYECYINLQYTKTAGVLAGAGMLLLWHGLLGKSARTEAGRAIAKESGRDGTGAEEPGSIGRAGENPAGAGTIFVFSEPPGRILWGSAAAGLLLCVLSIL